MLKTYAVGRIRFKVIDVCEVLEGTPIGYAVNVLTADELKQYLQLLLQQLEENPNALPRKIVILKIP